LILPKSREMDIQKELKKFGYVDTIIYKEVLFPTDNFFIDGIYMIGEVYYCAISAPLYKIKGILELMSDEYDNISSTYVKKFNVTIEQYPKEIIIRRQYGMRKVLKSEFDPKRYIVRVGFPDFPSCPYGHRYKMLGYDLDEKVYVRLASKILSDEALQIEKYKE